MSCSTHPVQEDGHEDDDRRDDEHLRRVVGDSNGQLRRSGRSWRDGHGGSATTGACARRGRLLVPRTSSVAGHASRSVGVLLLASSSSSSSSVAGSRSSPSGAGSSGLGSTARQNGLGREGLRLDHAATGLRRARAAWASASGAASAAVAALQCRHLVCVGRRFGVALGSIGHGSYLSLASAANHLAAGHAGASVAGGRDPTLGDESR